MVVSVLNVVKLVIFQERVKKSGQFLYKVNKNFDRDKKTAAALSFETVAAVLYSTQLKPVEYEPA